MESSAEARLHAVAVRPHGGRRRLSRALLTLSLVFGVLAALLGVSLLPWLVTHYQLKTAKAHLLRRDYSRAVAALERIQRIQPHNGLAQFYLARMYRRLNDETQFSRHLEEAQRRGVPWERAQREWQLWTAQHGELALVEPYVGKLLAQPSEEIPDTCEAFARGFLLTLRLADARRMLETWEQQAPADGMLHLLRGHLLSAQQAWSQAAEAYRQAVALLPGDAEATVSLAEALLEHDQWQQAAPLFDQLIQRQANDLLRQRAMRGLIRCQLYMGQDQLAGQLLEQWTAWHRLEGDDLRLAARVELRRRRPEQALAWLEPLLEKWPGDVEGHRLRIEALQQLGREAEIATSNAVIESGMAQLEKLPSLQQVAFEQPRNAVLRLDVGRVLVDCQSRQAGLRWLEAAVLVDPYLRAGREKLIETYLKLGATDRAAHHQKFLDASSRGAL